MRYFDYSVETTLKEQFSLAHAKKAYGGGVAGAIAGAGTISLTGILADGKLDGTEVSQLLAAIGGGFVLGFFGAWLPSKPSDATTTTPSTGNDPTPLEDDDALVPGDGLADTPPRHLAQPTK